MRNGKWNDVKLFVMSFFPFFKYLLLVIGLMMLILFVAILLGIVTVFITDTP